MPSIDALVNQGDRVDPELVSLLAGEGVETVDAVRSAGRAHFVDLFAERAGFTRDFLTILDELGLTWETAASAERFQCPVDEMEIGVPASMVAESLGASTFGDVFTHSLETVKAKMAARDGLLGELDDFIARHGGW